jgi:hypothetical protein
MLGWLLSIFSAPVRVASVVGVGNVDGEKISFTMEKIIFTRSKIRVIVV